MNLFIEEMFEDPRQVDPGSIQGNAFGQHGLNFALIDGSQTYKVVFRQGMNVYEFFTESDI